MFIPEQQVLTQKRELADEYPISFMSTRLQGAELNYPAIDNKAYAVFQVVKQFKPYILKNRKIHKAFKHYAKHEPGQDTTHKIKAKTGQR